MRHISNTLTKSALWLLLVVGSAPAWANDCPDPIVAYTLVLDGKDSEYAAQAGDFPTGKLGVLANHLVNRLILENADGIRWFSSAFGNDDADFSLVVTETTGSSAHTFAFTITDQEGGVVLATDATSVPRDEIAPGNIDALTEAQTANARPLFPKLREYQIRVRERDESAIFARLEFDPASASIAPGDKLPLTATLTDCDDDHPALPDRFVEFVLEGPGALDPPNGTTNTQGEIPFTFKASEPGETVVEGFWAYVNTSGNKTLSHSEWAVINVGGMHFSQIGISPQSIDGSSAEERYLASLWLLANDLIETYHPKRGLARSRRVSSTLCKAKVIKPTFQILPGARKNWRPEGETGNQSAWSEIVADLTDPTEAVLRFNVGASGNPEPDWDEEHGSEIISVVSLDFMVEVQNPEEQSYDLVFDPKRVVAQNLGASDYGVAIYLLSAKGCGGKYPMEYSLDSFSDRFDQYLDESGGKVRLRVNGDRHLQVDMRVTGIASAYGNIMEPPFDGNSKIDVELRFKITPAPDE